MLRTPSLMSNNDPNARNAIKYIEEFITEEEQKRLTWWARSWPQGKNLEKEVGQNTQTNIEALDGK